MGKVSWVRPVAYTQILRGVHRFFFPGSLPVSGYREYACSRADAQVWLGHLQGNTLVCDCELVGAEECHAAVLGEMVAQWCPEREQFAGDHPCDEELFDALPEDDPSLTVRDKEFGWAPAVEVGGDAQRQWCESLRGAPASGLHFTQEWKRYAAHIRSFGCKLALEVFAGTCFITSILAEWGIPVAPPVEILIFEWMDLLNPMFVYLLIGLILEGRFWFLWLAPPCSTFSMACNRFIATMLRNSTLV